MASSAGRGTPAGVAAMGWTPGQLVQELGWDSDVDEDLRDGVMDAIEGDLIYDAVEAVDAVLLWWREADGEVADGLVECLTDLSQTGYIWLLTPKVGRDGYVVPTDLAEGALSAGLALANQAIVSPEWQAQKLVRPKGSRR